MVEERPVASLLWYVLGNKNFLQSEEGLAPVCSTLWTVLEAEREAGQGVDDKRKTSSERKE